MSSGTIVDSNVLVDLFTEDRLWADWSAAQLGRAFDEGPVLINPLIYAELSVGFDRIEDLDDALPSESSERTSRGEPGFLLDAAFPSVAVQEGRVDHRFPTFTGCQCAGRRTGRRRRAQPRA